MSHRGGQGHALISPEVPLHPASDAAPARAVAPVVAPQAAAAKAAPETGTQLPPLHQSWSWEDPDVLVRALLPAAAGVVLLPSGPGDDALTMLAAGADRVIAADANPSQLALTELKLAAVRALDLTAARGLLGLTSSSVRVSTWHRLAGRRGPGLSQHACDWLDANEAYAHAGVLSAGRVETAARQLRAAISESVRFGTLTRLLDEIDGPARARRLARITGGRWRLAFRLNLDGVLPGVSPTVVRQRVEQGILQGPDFQVTWLLTGMCLQPEAAHPYLTTRGQWALRQAGGLELVQTHVVDVMATSPPGSLGAVHLGLEEQLPGGLQPALAAAAHALRRGGRLFLRSTRPLASLDGPFLVDTQATHLLTQRDRCLNARSLVVATRR